MTPQEKRQKTLKNKLLARLRSSPSGVSTILMPLAERRLLRQCEADGLIEYKNGLWFLTVFIQPQPDNKEKEMDDDKDEDLPIPDQLRDVLMKNLGDNWSATVDLPIRADKLYWLVHLACVGIETRRKNWLQDKKNLDAGQIASLASWKIELENLVKKTKEVTLKLRKK